MKGNLQFHNKPALDNISPCVGVKIFEVKAISFTSFTSCDELHLESLLRDNFVSEMDF